MNVNEHDCSITITSRQLIRLPHNSCFIIATKELLVGAATGIKKRVKQRSYPPHIRRVLRFSCVLHPNLQPTSSLVLLLKMKCLLILLIISCATVAFAASPGASKPPLGKTTVHSKPPLGKTAVHSKPPASRTTAPSKRTNMQNFSHLRLLKL
jgi:hypothetical protein